MNWGVIADNWALILAAFPALLVLVLVLRFLLGRSANGQLQNVIKNYRAAQKELSAAHKLRKKTAARVNRMSAKAETSKPRLIREASEAAEDAKLLERIASDKVQVAANHVRRVIHEEFPPVRQKKLREKYLPQDAANGRPYTF